MGLGLVGLCFIECGRQAFLFDLFEEDVPGNPGEDLFLDPVGIAADFPFAEVLFVDGMTAEFLLEDGLDFGKAIEPGDETDGGDAILDALAELTANFIGQFPDFTGV